MGVIGASLNGTAQGTYKILIIDYAHDYKNCKMLYSSEYENMEELEIGLKELSRKFIIENFILIYGPHSVLETMKDGFDYARDGAYIIKKFESLKEKEKSKKALLINSLENLNKRVDVVEPKKVFNELVKILKIYFPVMEDIPKKLNPTTDRDFLDLSIQIFSLLYSQAHNLEYGKNIYPQGLENHPFMVKLLKYKMKHYGKEIFGSLGVEIVGKSKNGYIIKEEIPKSKNIN